MGETLLATSKAADAPDIDAGIYDAKFDGLSKKFIEGGDYGAGDRFVWTFTLLDDDGTPINEDRPEHARFGQPIEVDGLTSLSLNTTSRTRPKALRYMEALLTPTEFAAWVGGEAKLDADSLKGRTVQVEIFIRDNGWPSVDNVLPKRTRRARSAGPVEGTSNTGDLPF